MMVMLDKLQEEKLRASTELMRLSTSKQKLSRQVRALDGSTEVSDLMRSNERTCSKLHEEISSLKGALTLRDNKIEALVKELEIAHRSMEVQNNYQNPHKYPHIAAVTSDTSREAMRTLYFDLGKKQAEIHALTLTLSDVKHQLGDLLMEKQDLEAARDSLLAENERLRSSVDSFTSQSIGYNDTISDQQYQLQSKDEKIRQLQHSLSENSQRLTQLKLACDEDFQSKDAKIAELTQLWTLSEREKATIANRFDALQQTTASMETSNAATIRRLQDELHKLKEDSRQLSFRDGECASLRAQLESTQLSCSNLQIEKAALDETVTQLRQQLQSTKEELEKSTNELATTQSKLLSSDMILTNKREEFNQAATERDETVEALKHTMSVARDLSQKYQKERELRYAAEKMSEQLQKAKNNFSAATIEALHREKQRTAALAKSLSLIPLLLRYKDLQWKDPTVPFSSTKKPNQTSSARGSEQDNLRLLHYNEDPSIDLPSQRDEESIEPHHLFSNDSQLAGPPPLFGLRTCTPAECLSEIIDAARPPTARKTEIEVDAMHGTSIVKKPLSSSVRAVSKINAPTDTIEEIQHHQHSRSDSGDQCHILMGVLEPDKKQARKDIPRRGSSSSESSTASSESDVRHEIAGDAKDTDASLVTELKRCDDVTIF